jgi:DNA mismatch repair protein MutS
MGGKSTVMRQTALIVILGQMGAPVPARSAQWGVFSSVYTRIGAQDAIARGQSTFMVEMSELAHILHYADDQSLLILDEIGRGTSTYDGMSVAWATLEWMSQQIGARTLFATHYHELIHLSEILPRLANAHLAVENEKSRTTQSLRFLYELKEGPTNESFGIQVAQMAGLPKTVIDRAWGILGDLESNKNSNGNSDGASQPAAESVSQSPRQLSLFDTPAPTPSPVVHPLLSELQELNLNEMTPIQAWTFLNDAQKSISKK